MSDTGGASPPTSVRPTLAVTSAPSARPSAAPAQVGLALPPSDAVTGTGRSLRSYAASIAGSTGTFARASRNWASRWLAVPLLGLCGVLGPSLLSLPYFVATLYAMCRWQRASSETRT